MVGSEVEVHEVLSDLVQEEATESLRLLSTSSDGPIVVEYDSRSRAVEIEVECYICNSRTVVNYYEVELLVASLNLRKVEVEPFLASSDRFASPLEGNSLGTSIVDDFFLLIHFGCDGDLLVRSHLQIYIIQSKLAKLSERYIARISKHLLKDRLAIGILSKIKSSRQCPNLMTFTYDVVVYSTITSRWN